MSKIIKRKYVERRKEFKNDLYESMKDNPAYAMMVLKTYTASQHRKHIGEIWWLSRDYKDFQEAYNKELFGKHLTGRDELFHSLYFADRELYDKYRRLIPESFAMGDALAVAYRVLKEGK